MWNIPYETQYVQNIVTPVVAGDTVVFSGYNRGVTAYRIASANDGLEAEKIWDNAEATMYMNSPVLVGDILLVRNNQEMAAFRLSIVQS